MRSCREDGLLEVFPDLGFLIHFIRDADPQHGGTQFLVDGLERLGMPADVVVGAPVWTILRGHTPLGDGLEVLGLDCDGDGRRIRRRGGNDSRFSSRLKR